MEAAQQQVKVEQEDNLIELGNLISHMAQNCKVDNPMNASGKLIISCKPYFLLSHINIFTEFVDVDMGVEFEVPSDQDIIQLVEHASDENSAQPSEQDEQEQQVHSNVSHEKALKNLEEIELYFLQQPDDFNATESDRAAVRRLKKEVLRVSLYEKRQSNIAEFFHSAD